MPGTRVSASRRSASCSNALATSGDRTCWRRRTSSRPTTSRPRSTSARTSRCRPTSAAGLASLAPLLGGAAGGQASRPGRPRRARRARLGAPRQDVGTKIKITPHINDSNQVRLEIEEEISEHGRAARRPRAPSRSPSARRSTTVVVDDQQTVVIGGLMRDTSYDQPRDKVPVLGDIRCSARSSEAARRPSARRTCS